MDVVSHLSPKKNAPQLLVLVSSVSMVRVPESREHPRTVITSGGSIVYFTQAQAKILLFTSTIEQNLAHLPRVVIDAGELDAR